MRRSASMALLAVAAWSAAPPAWAATVDEAADAARDSGYYVDDGISVDRTALGDAIGRASNAGVRVNVVLLDDDPASGATTYADAVLDRIGEGTVLVLSATGEGAASTRFGQAALEDALDAGFAAGGGDVGYVEAFIASLVPEAGGDGSSSEGGGGGGSGLVILLVIVGGLMVLAWWAIRRQKKAAERRQAEAVAEARGEIETQLNAMANIILEITDRVSVSESREDNTYLEQASATYTGASEDFESAEDLAALEALSERLDEARWQLDAAEAISHGKPVPEKPAPQQRHACFFDPTHAGPFEDAQIRTASGERTVKVCGPDADRLRRGDDPRPRMIEVRGRQVPAAAAPRSHGGGGIDLGSVFSVVLGEAGRSFEWGVPTRRRGGWSASSSPRRSTSTRRSTSAGSRSRAGRTRRRGR